MTIPSDIQETISGQLAQLEQIERQASSILRLAQRTRDSYREDPETVAELSQTILEINNICQEAEGVKQLLEEIRQSLTENPPDDLLQQMRNDLTQMDGYIISARQDLMNQFAILEGYFYADE
ncbi:MAG: hypothetical protein LDL41_03275 [Coleofasciculus sp. S288]|nr:hypothetical protein [Coleofasciculus sp. S288]